MEKEFRRVHDPRREDPGASAYVLEGARRLVGHCASRESIWETARGEESYIMRSLSSLATTPRSRNSAIIKLITTRIATKTLLKLASRYLARKSGTGGPACRSPYPRLASGIATLKM